MLESFFGFFFLAKNYSRRITATFPNNFCFTFYSFVSLFSSQGPGGASAPLVGSNGLEPSTSRLSGVRSNHLSYEPVLQPVVSNQPDIAANTLAYLRRFSRSEKLLWPFVVPSGQTVASATYRLPCATTVFPFVQTAARRASAAPPWWRRTESNCRPPACKAGALPAELRPRVRFVPG